MQTPPLETPVALLIFNRPDLTAKVFEVIRRARPKQLLVVADGPRNEQERPRCEAARAVIEVDWECELSTNYSDVNLGCKRRVASGIDWVFENHEEAIILEDDCLPALSFFPFCQAMLERYRNDERITSVGGMNLYPHSAIRGDETYFFARYGPTNGWGSWRRAWKHFDVAMTDWPEFKRSGRIKDLFETRLEQWYWTLLFDAQYRSRIDTWDYQWLFTRLSLGGLSVVPKVNMVANLGFRPDGTHTFKMPKVWEPAKECHELWDIVEPPYVLANREVDRFYFEKLMGGAAGLAMFGVNQLVKTLRNR